MWMINAYALTAKKNIKRGEELTADYALWEAGEDFVIEKIEVVSLRFRKKLLSFKEGFVKPLKHAIVTV